MKDLFALIYQWLGQQYEARKWYRFNPCDHDAFDALKPVGRALARFMVMCPCCSTVRMLVIVAGTVVWPMWTLAVLAALFAVFLGEEIRHPTKETEHA